MSKGIGLVRSTALVLGLMGAFAVVPAVGEAADGAKMTLSLTKDYTASSWTQESGWSNRASAKLGFGLKNLLVGWTEIFLEPKKAADEGGNVFVGIGKGLVNAVGNEVGGVIHTVTFPLTELDAPLPNGGTQLLSS
ncbi:MAG: hypothetical protein HY737_05270 [Candidatus Omnitrophica bacterium]|nr:hypothetical protein [Candidatus Omnitrophota bacterium]